MLTIATLPPGCEAYYELSVAAGLDDFNAGRGESPGVWVGRAASSLGLEGVVSVGQLGALMEGLDPSTYERLRRHRKAWVVTVERTSRESGERVPVQKTFSPVAGFDLVFSAPKSVSLLHALGEDESRQAASEAHLSAWQAAVCYLEDEACVLRRGADGRIRERGEGFVAAAYQHRTSRAQDPHLHTHVVAANAARSPSDGKWRTLDGGAILRHYKRAASYLYEAHLRYELSRSLAVEWAAPAKGSADVKGVSRGVIEAFSTRGRQVAERMDERGLVSAAAARLARLETRQPKEQDDLTPLRANWSARAADHGLDPRLLDRLVHRSRYREPTTLEIARIARRLLGQNGLARPGIVFSELELVMAWAEALPHGAPAERIRHLARRFLEIDGVQRVGGRALPGRPGRHSASALCEREKSLRRLEELCFAQPPEHAAIDRFADGPQLAPSSAGRRELESHSEAERRIGSVRSTGSSRARTAPALSPSERERRAGEPGLEL